MTEFGPLTPPVDRYAPPPFHEMRNHPKRFEGMSCALLEQDARFSNAELYGLGGQKQFGIDAIADFGACAKVVQSSKCYVDATASDIKKWSDEFLQHFVYKWRDQNVVHFILSVSATNMADIKILAQIDLEKARFKNLGIEYEVWHPERLTSRLQKCRTVVLRFLDAVWANLLCGPDTPGSGNIVSAALIQQLHTTQQSLSNHVSARLEEALSQYDQGNFNKIDDILIEIKAETTWAELNPGVQSSALRLAARVAAARGDLVSAKNMALAAQALCAEEPRLEAYLAAREGNIPKAINILKGSGSIKARQLMAALLLDSNDLPGAMATIQALFDEEPNNAENWRLQAALHMMERRWDFALAAAEKAIELHPLRLEIIRTVALCRYGNVLSPAVSKAAYYFPNPIEWRFVKIGPESVRLLERARDAWSLLLQKETTGKDAKLWNIACLANQLTRQSEAEAACRRLLLEDPTEIVGIYWVLVRGYGIDLTDSIAALRELISSGKADPNQVRCFGILVHRLQGDEESKKELSNLLPYLDQAGRKEAEEWIAVLEGAGPTEDQDGEPALSDDEVGTAMKLAAKNDYEKVTQHLNLYLGDTRLGSRGLPYAEMVANRGWWSALAPYVEKLLQFETAAAVGLAANVLINTGCADQVPELLSAKRQEFENGVLPLPMRRLEAAAYSDSGRLPEAIQRAQTIASASGESDDWLTLVSYYRQSGNIQACVPILKNLLRKHELPAARAIEFSIAIDREDLSFAKQLWLFAMKEGIPEKYLLHALTQAFRLGLDDQAGPLMVRLGQRAQRGATDTRLVSMDELLEEVRSRRENAESAIELLKKGAIPIHVVPPHLIFSLAELYRLDSSRVGARAMRPLFMRHAARPARVVYPTPLPNWRIHLDITGLLLASELEILEFFETVENPIVISRRLPFILVNLERNASDQQVSRVENCKSIIAAIADGRVQVAGIERSEFFTVRHDSEREESRNKGVTVDSVLSSLQKNGLTEVTIAQVGSASDQQGPIDPALLTEPQIGQRLIFDSNTLETIAGKGVLQEVLSAFEVHIPEESLTSIRDYISEAEAGTSLADRVRSLRDRVATGIESGQYVFAKRNSADSTFFGGESDHDLLKESLGDLLMAENVEHGVLWADDRYLSGYDRAGTNFVVGSLEVLQALVRSGKMSEELYWKKLSSLRANGAIFIPLESREILEALRNAPIKDGRVVETPSLKVLRRNIATALELDPYLKLGEHEIEALAGRPDEMPFLLAVRGAVQEAIVSIWSDASYTSEKRIALSDYVWSALRMEHCIRPLPVNDPGQGNRLFAAFGVADLLNAAQEIHLSTAGKSLERQKEYLHWANFVTLHKRAGPDVEDFLDLVAANLRALQEASLSFDPGDEKSRQLLSYLRTEHIKMLPESLVGRLLNDHSFAKSVGMRRVHTASAGGRNYDPEKFWRAISKALKRGSAKLADTDGNFVEIKELEGTIFFSSNTKLGFYEPFFDVLKSESVTAHHKLRKFLESLDLLPGEKEDFIHRYGKAKTPHDQAELLLEAKGLSVIFGYEAVRDSFNGGRDFPSSVLNPPPAKRLLHHMRLICGGDDFGTCLEASWRKLSDQFGTDEAFRRLAGLPVDITKLVLLKPTSELDAPTGAFMSSPIAWLHFAAINQRRGKCDLASKRVAELLESTDREVSLLVRLLEWTTIAFFNDPEWKAMLASEQLATVWCHAHHICCLFVEGPLDISAAVAWFSANPPAQTILDRLSARPIFEVDCSNPSTLEDTSLLYHGLSYVFPNLDPLDQVQAELQIALKARFFALNTSGEHYLGAEHYSRVDAKMNLMDGFLGQMPIGALSPQPSGPHTKITALNQALTDLETNPTMLEAWGILFQIGRVGMDEIVNSRLISRAEEMGFEDIVTHPDWALVANISTKVLRRAQAFGEENMLEARISKLSAKCSASFGGPVTLANIDRDGAEGEAAKALSGVFEMALSAARSETEIMGADRLCRFIVAIVTAWPQAAGSARILMDGLVREISPGHVPMIWKTFLILREFA